MERPPDPERAAREIVLRAREGQKRPSRWMRIAALVVSAVCVGALAIGLVTSEPRAAAPHHAVESDGGGLGTGLILGLGVGIVIGSLFAVRRR